MRLSLRGRLAFQLRGLWQLAESIVGVLLQRLLYGPQRAGWTQRFEIALHFWRKQLEYALSLPESAQAREYLDAVQFIQPVQRRVRTDAELGGPVPARWLNSASTRGVLLYFHGGGFELDPRQLDALRCHIAEATGMRMLAPQYRLAPEHPHPAALDDALSAYQWLLAKGVAADELVVGGDSAGGALSLCLLGRLRAQRMPLPAGVFGLCPWTDLTNFGASYERNLSTDYLSRVASDRWAALYAPGRDLRDPLISAVQLDFSEFPPIYLQGGGSEVLIDQIRVCAERAAHAGAAVRLDEWEFMNHVFQGYGDDQPESRAALDRLGQFTTAVLEGRGAGWLKTPDVAGPAATWSAASP